jgi:hypothetical protein
MEYVKRGPSGAPKGKGKRSLLDFIWRAQAITPASKAPGEGKQAGIGVFDAREASQDAPPRLSRTTATLEERYVGPRAVKGAGDVFGPTLYSPADVTQAAAGNGNPGTSVGGGCSDWALSSVRVGRTARFSSMASLWDGLLHIDSSTSSPIAVASGTYDTVAERATAPAATTESFSSFP